MKVIIDSIYKHNNTTYCIFSTDVDCARVDHTSSHLVRSPADVSTNCGSVYADWRRVWRNTVVVRWKQIDGRKNNNSNREEQSWRRKDRRSLQFAAPRNCVLDRKSHHPNRFRRSRHLAQRLLLAQPQPHYCCRSSWILIRPRVWVPLPIASLWMMTPGVYLSYLCESNSNRDHFLDCDLTPSTSVWVAVLWVSCMSRRQWSIKI